jgi:peptidyl-prolyl cis-trans isomerase B (cyclophilin B)
MARTGDPHSATAQFFINVADNGFPEPHRDFGQQGWGYAVFGKVISGIRRGRQNQGRQDQQKRLSR